MNAIPEDVVDLIGKPCFPQVSDCQVEAGAIRSFAAAVEDGFPAFWTDEADNMLAPPALLSAWNRSLMWAPEGKGEGSGLALHFLLKRKLGLPRAVVAETETELADPIRPGVRVKCEQVLVDVGEPCTTRLGEGRYWTIRVEYRCAATGAFFGAETMRFFGYGREADT
ncbi:hypothetical protein MB02_00075 [Croceicoccus estronivorus]|uniref:FAS1-like dehydratase domain-containing protein n=1 Tax=Croceicoccus estronivorus TaxID=1172626 RepID=UPI00082CAD46|nr:MaoC family dehydratase N-terminal domain-containing protein [Croceicoccus estronivorus]OCC25133.1 hypothetical protein MB02_00075 [Croceicoccus estronivorus]